jgi:hypothetical protein
MDWMNPLNRVEIAKAVKANRKTVKLLGGETFAITYPDEDTIHMEQISPRAMVPRGYFERKKVLDLRFGDAT